MLPHERPELIPREEESNEFDVALECRENDGLWLTCEIWSTFFKNLVSFFDAAIVVIESNNISQCLTSGSIVRKPLKRIYEIARPMLLSKRKHHNLKELISAGAKSEGVGPASTQEVLFGRNYD